MDIDTERVGESILAPLAPFAFEKTQSWKSYNWEARRRLHAKGFIENPVRAERPQGRRPARPRRAPRTQGTVWLQRLVSPVSSKPSQKRVSRFERQ